MKIAKPFLWTPEASTALNKIKEALAGDPFIILPDYTKDFHVWCDAGPNWLGGMLGQKDEDSDLYLPVAWHTKKLSTTETGYSQVEKEALAIVSMFKTHCHILTYGYTIIHSDCKSLTFLKAFSGVNRKLARWMTFIDSFPHALQWESSKEKLMMLVDMMSRQTIEESLNKRPDLAQMEFFTGPTLNQDKLWTRTEYKKEIVKHLKKVKFEPAHPAKEKVYLILSEKDSIQTYEKEMDEMKKEAMVPAVNYEEGHTCIHCAQQERIGFLKETIKMTIEEIEDEQETVEDDIEKYDNLNTPEAQLFKAVFKETAMLSLKKLTKLQRKDELLGKIIEKLENNDKEVRKKYALKDKCLVKKIAWLPRKERYVICWPNSLTPMLLRDIHSSHHSGHPTAKKMEKILAPTFLIQNVRANCRLTIQNCTLCCQFKALTKLKRTQKSVFRAEGPNHVVHSDIITISGKYEEGLTHPEYSQVLTFVDAFTNFIIAVPIGKSITGEEIWKLFSLHWLQYFGAPMYFMSDNAKNYQNQLINLACPLTQIQKVQIAPYMSRGNISERMQRAFLMMISMAKKELNAKPDQWPILLNMAILAWNTTPNEATGISPAFAFIGRSNPQGLKNFVSLEFAENCDDYCQNMIIAQEMISQVLENKRTLANQKKQDESPVERRRRDENSFPERTLVYVRRDIPAIDPMHKLRPKFTGPYIVQKEFETKVHLQPFTNKDIQDDLASVRLLGQGRPVKLSCKVVDKTFLKKVKGLNIFTTGQAKELKKEFKKGIDFNNVRYELTRDQHILGEEDSVEGGTTNSSEMESVSRHTATSFPSSIHTWCDAAFWDLKKTAEGRPTTSNDSLQDKQAAPVKKQKFKNNKKRAKETTTTDSSSEKINTIAATCSSTIDREVSQTALSINKEVSQTSPSLTKKVSQTLSSINHEVSQTSSNIGQKKAKRKVSQTLPKYLQKQQKKEAEKTLGTMGQADSQVDSEYEEKSHQRSEVGSRLVPHRQDSLREHNRGQVEVQYNHSPEMITDIPKAARQKKPKKKKTSKKPTTPGRVQPARDAKKKANK